MMGNEGQVLSVAVVAAMLHWISVLLLIRYMRIDQKSGIWNFFAMAIGLMAIQKTYACYMAYFWGEPSGLTLTSEIVCVLIAALLLGGVLLVPGISRRLARNDELLEVIDERDIIVYRFHDRLARDLRQMQIAMEIGKPMNFVIEHVANLNGLLQGFIEDLKAGVLLGNNFGISVKTLVENLTRESSFPVKVFVEKEVSENLSQEQGTELLHVLREAVKNSVAYSEAKKGLVSVKKTDTDIRLEVKDNGKGFEVDLVGAQGHGLGTMVERAKKMGARLKIHSQPKKGTTVSLEIPIGSHAKNGRPTQKSAPQLVGSGA